MDDSFEHLPTDERSRIRHDLRSILGVAIGYCDLARHGRDDGARQAYLDKLDQALTQLDDRIEQTLGASLGDGPGE